MAAALLHPPGPTLIAVGGFSGSGKSTLAFGLAPSIGAVPGAVMLRSDEIRKQLCGVSAPERLGPAGYTAGVSERVYRMLVERASAVLRAGHAVIVDAVHASSKDRQAIERVGKDAGVPFVGFWLDAPQDTLIARSSRRRGDASDADADVIRMQSNLETGPIDGGGWTRRHLRSGCWSTRAVPWVSRRPDLLTELALTNLIQVVDRQFAVWLHDDPIVDVCDPWRVCRGTLG